MKNYEDEIIRVGLDIGIASVGWAVLRCNENGEPQRILGLGSRIFDKAEENDGGSLSAKRRDARSIRRRLRRKSERLRRLRALLNDYGVEINFVGEDVNMLRVKGLDSLLSENDFARILYLLCKNRGFKSTKIDNKTSKEGELLKNANGNRALMQEKGYRTVGEMIYHEFVASARSYDGKWHNGRNDYSHTVYRDDLISELKLLFAKQRELKNALALSDIEDKYFEIFSSQRSYDLGPGKGSPYTAQFAVGDCAFEKGEKRAPKASYSFEWSRALEKLNNVRIKSDDDSRSLTDEERAIAIQAMRAEDTLNFSNLRKIIGLGDDEVFNISYPKVDLKEFESKYNDDGVTEEEKELKRQEYVIKKRNAHEQKEILSSLIESNKIKNALDEAHRLDTELIDSIAEALSYAKSEQKRSEIFADEKFARLTQEEIERVCELNCDKFGMLSLKALKKIIPHLEAGVKYSDACKIEYGDTIKSTVRTKFLNTEEVYETLQDITAPVVKRAVSQTLKVLNAIIRKYGSPIAVNVELAREMSRSFDERKQLEKQMKDRFAENDKIKSRIANEFGRNPSGIDIVKMRLYEEQGGKCIYSGKPIDLTRLFDGTSYQVDHVMPFSRSFNDSYNNKVLVLTSENQNKGNRLPYEYMTYEQYNEFEARVRTLYSGNRAKRDILLRKKLDETEWQTSALNDTRYISTFVKNLIETHLVFDERVAGKKRVFTYNGAMTAYVRKQWGIEKIRSDGDLHHAVDAAVIGCMTESMRMRIEKYNLYREVYRERGAHIINDEIFDPVTGESFEEYNVLPFPYATFRKELIARTMDDLDDIRKRLCKIGYPEDDLDNISVVQASRMPRRKMKGKLHKETLNSAKRLDKGEILCKTPITKLKLDKDGEIDGYYNGGNDKALYELLRDKLRSADGNAAKAFEAGYVFKPKKDGSDGPKVYSVKTYIKSTSGVLLKKNGAIADNESMSRVDVYTKDGKFYLVPVYVSDVYAGKLPTKAATQHKNEEDWRDMSDGYDFLFSLHKNDMIFVENKRPMKMTKLVNDEKSKLPKEKEITSCFGYFSGMDRSTVNIQFEDVNGCYKCRVGAQNLKTFLKYEVGVLGDIHLVKCEKCLPLHRPKT